MYQVSPLLSHISIIGDEGKPVLYASMTQEGKLFFEFELYGRNENEGDCGFSYTVEPEKSSQKLPLNSD
jgi:hypothetical protein